MSARDAWAVALVRRWRDRLDAMGWSASAPHGLFAYQGEAVMASEVRRPRAAVPAGARVALVVGIGQADDREALVIELEDGSLVGAPAPRVIGLGPELLAIEDGAGSGRFDVVIRERLDEATVARGLTEPEARAFGAADHRQPGRARAPVVERRADVNSETGQPG